MRNPLRLLPHQSHVITPMTTPIQRSREQIYITKSHLLALGTSTLLVVGISFFVGFRAGAAQFEPEPNPSIAQVLPEADQQATLESLLRQIEDAQQSGTERPFQFPSELPSNEARDVPDPPPKEEAPSTQSETTPGPIPSAPEGCKAAEPGWFVQVRAHSNIDEALSQTATLSEKLDVGVHCFTAVVDDTKWYRVRVGPYDNEELANTKKELIETLLGESGFIVSKAP